MFVGSVPEAWRESLTAVWSCAVGAAGPGVFPRVFFGMDLMRRCTVFGMLTDSNIWDSLRLGFDLSRSRSRCASLARCSIPLVSLPNWSRFFFASFSSLCSSLMVSSAVFDIISVSLLMVGILSFGGVGLPIRFVPIPLLL